MEDDSETVYKTGIKLASPSVFDGDRRKAILWLKQVETYLTINEGTYNSDMKKVAFISKLLGSVQLCAEPHSTQDRQLSPY
jgi:hypothetical protein